LFFVNLCLQIAISILFSFGAEHDGSGGNCSAKDAAQNGRFLMSRYSGETLSLHSKYIFLFSS
jgi:hypothetical protein